MTAGAQYAYRVAAYNAAGLSAYSNVASVTTQSGLAPEDVALYAGEAPVRQGAWAVTADGTAAGGVRLYNRDAGLAKVTTPAANPVDYFEMTFNAQAGRAYRLWIWGKALNNAYPNDSVWVQFSDSVERQQGGRLADRLDVGYRAERRRVLRVRLVGLGLARQRVGGRRARRARLLRDIRHAIGFASSGARTASPSTRLS